MGGPWRALGEAPRLFPTLPLGGSDLRISQEEVGPDLIDVAHHGGPTDPQQALQGGQCGRLVGGHGDRPVDLGSPEVLLLQGIHPGTGWTPRWLEACSQKLGPAGPEAQVILGCAGRTLASSCEVTNQLSWAEAETISPGTRESTSCYPLSHPLQRPLRSETLAKWSLGLPVCGDEPKHIRPLKSLVTWDFARMEASDGCGPLLCYLQG